MLRTLLAETDGALARLALAQLASSDANQPAGIGRADMAAASGWTFEVPLVADGRTSIAQIEIRRDDSRAAATGETAPAGASSSPIDVEPAGPVHAVLALRGSDLSVSLWAERPETMALLQAEGGGFAALLADQDLTLERLFVRGGRPDTPPEPVRHLVNRVT
ncbi:MAG: flagellar hook-length control protein FliK [Blastochloris sp.]|nr:flagellar hook-length control protein FliK [Blastochloris sp.]